MVLWHLDLESDWSPSLRAAGPLYNYGLEGTSNTPQNYRVHIV